MTYEKKIIAKTLFKLSNLKSENIEFLDTLKKIKNPKVLLSELQKHQLAFPMDRQSLIQFLGKAKQMNLFQKHFLIPDMEKGWRFWVKEHGLGNQFRFES